MREIITLSNGKRVGNFSSPHPFRFTDGKVLAAVSNSEAERLKVTFIEDVDKDGDVTLSFELSADVWDEMAAWELLWHNCKVDVVFCPLPMITAIKSNPPSPAYSYRIPLKNSPFRTIRIEDRIEKLISIEKQCV